MACLTITTTEMHTGGEPVRIVETGLPEVRGNTILDKRRYFRDNFDNIRKFLIYEPRGHYDMYGVLLVPTDVPGADMACLFIHNEGYSTMCGHAVVSLGRYAIDKGFVKEPTSPETRLVIQCPCGPVEVFVEYSAGKTGHVRFHSVPSFLYAQDVECELPGYGKVNVDISYGGAFYALVPAARLGLDMNTSNTEEIRAAAGSVTDSLRKTLKLTHPDDNDLAFLYGTIVTDGNDDGSSDESKNVCVFAEREVDRSPCGSGVSARIAQQFGRGLLQLHQPRTFTGPTGAGFKAKAVRQVTCGSHEAVIVEVSGKGHYTGSCTFTLEEGDEIGRGFLLK